MKKITFKSEANAAKWIVGEFEKIRKSKENRQDLETTILIATESDSERLKLLNEFIRKGILLNTLNIGSDGVILLSDDGLDIVHTEDEKYNGKKYDIILVHGITKLMKDTVKIISKRTSRPIRYNYEHEEQTFRNEINDVEKKDEVKSEMSTKEDVDLPGGLKISEDGHEVSYNINTDNGMKRFRFYTSDDIDRGTMIKIAKRFVEDV